VESCYLRRPPNDLRELPDENDLLLPLLCALLRLLLLPKPPEPTERLVLRVLKLLCEDVGVLSDDLPDLASE
jgi:hypothetical protein